MIQPLYTKEQRQELIQKQIIMHGGSIEGLSESKIKLNPEQIKQLIKDYRDMYYGLTSINWSQGMTLGMAWQKALQQMGSFIETKLKISNHPINAYLVKYHAIFRRRISKHIMDHKGKESETKLTKRLLKIFAADGTKEVQKGKSALNQWYQKYMPEQTIQKLPDIKKLEIAKQNIRSITIDSLFIRSRAA